MGNKDLLIAANTVWVVIAAILVMFMQAGFAFLEAGLTRMKNAAHIAGKNVLIFAVCSIVYWAVGFGIAFGDGNAIVDRKSTRLNSSHVAISYAVFCLEKKIIRQWRDVPDRGTPALVGPRAEQWRTTVT